MLLHATPTALVPRADVCPRTLDDGVIGHRLHASAIVIKRKVPHPRVQVLDESGLMDSDRVRAGPRVRLAQGPVLFGDEPAAVQQLDKVVLQNKTHNRFQELQKKKDGNLTSA